MNETPHKKQEQISFIIKCKHLFQLEVHPFDSRKYMDSNYLHLVSIARQEIGSKGLQNFLEYFLENQYLINLWAAKLGLEIGNPSSEEILLITDNNTIANSCIQVVERYKTAELTPEISDQMTSWLVSVKDKYRVA